MPRKKNHRGGLNNDEMERNFYGWKERNFYEKKERKKERNFYGRHALSILNTCRRISDVAAIVCKGQNIIN